MATSVEESQNTTLSYPLEVHYCGVNDQLQSADIADSKKRQTRGGKAIRNKKKPSGPKQVTIALAQRSKKKYVTIVVGLKTFEIDLKKASKYFAQKFSCGSSVTGDDEIVVQGDVTDNIIDIIQKKWPEIDDDSITDLGEQKR
ncbi:uncharacterized protein TRIADDRAFT_52695 [Trichoplax adhaerens]|uniref:Density-regulated protein n=1 Tax=Trichoplax adhaerens TaxID=10228 RepID=B3RJV8_TRIAD|nr:hypothetical protein TRIADDRAFT_52695 [Trichoplax adhaerens]EDV29852.1 hypothetical protein TRIADDRAFT_52695 [Trichoplax adhaerens]|eukprot:XP_002109054.1 hypothetical protein TRIADDRAFT_52695 [Trichoplax adhaerens]